MSKKYGIAAILVHQPLQLDSNALFLLKRYRECFYNLKTLNRVLGKDVSTVRVSQRYCSFREELLPSKFLMF